MRRLVFTMLIAVLFGECCAQSKKMLKLQKLSGKYKVGTVSYIWVDETSEEIATLNIKDNREFYVQIWYPAEVNSDNERAEYMPKVDAFGEMVGPQMLSRIKRTQTNSYINVPVANQEERYPVMLFSPGFGMSKYYYTMLFEHLASNGYIVVAIDYPYLNKLVSNDGETIDPDGQYWQSFPAAGAAEGTYAEAEQKLEMTVNYFADGQLFVLNKLKELNIDDPSGVFTGKLDFDRLASAGHSAGALGVKGLMARTDVPLKAYITYDVSIHQVIGARDIIVPHINNTTNPILMFVLEYASLPGYDFVNNLNTDIEIHVFGSMSHNSLSDLDYLYYEDKGMIDEAKQTRENLDKIFSQTLEFLDQEMKNSN